MLHSCVCTDTIKSADEDSTARSDVIFPVFLSCFPCSLGSVVVGEPW